MEAYQQRLVEFFFQSIRALKEKSGGQRWNAICEDATTLWEQTYPKEFGPLHLSHEERWELLFEPPETFQNPLYMKFEILCSRPGFPEYFFLILHSLVDPPTSWWQAQVKDPK
jgi:hypothetical protein